MRKVYPNKEKERVATPDKSFHPQAELVLTKRGRYKAEQKSLTGVNYHGH